MTGVARGAIAACTIFASTFLASTAVIAAGRDVSDDRPAGKIPTGATRLGLPLEQALDHVRRGQAHHGWMPVVPIGLLTARLDTVPLALLILERGGVRRTLVLFRDGREARATWVWEASPGGRQHDGQSARQAPGRRQVGKGKR